MYKSESFQAVKKLYGQKVSGLSDYDQKLYQFLEAGMENLIHGLPEQTQMLARMNFYQTALDRLTLPDAPESKTNQQTLDFD